MPSKKRGDLTAQFEAATVTPNVATNGAPNTMTQSQDAGLADLFYVDLENIKEPQPITPGRYNAVIKNAKPSRSAAGNGVMTVQWQLVDNEGEAAEFNGRSVFDPITWSENTMFRVKGFLSAIGVDPKFKGAPTPDALIGERACLTLDIEVSTKINDKTGEVYPPRARVKAYAPFGANESLESILSS